jgi:hypothetical protein
MSQPTYACRTAGCPREGQPTRARRCDTCGKSKHWTAGTPRDAARERTRTDGSVALIPPSQPRGRRGIGRKPAAAFAAIGALTLVGLRVLVRHQNGRAGHDSGRQGAMSD